jgi:hypothetical protein
MQITKCDAAGVAQVSYAGTVAVRQGDGVVIHARWTFGWRDLGYIVFAPDDRFTEYFYREQWFNIMRVGAAADDRLKGWYCNVTRPATITATTISYDDLLLDVWVGPNGACLVLDEDEFAAAALDVATRARATAGLAEVQRWAAERLGPFAELDGGYSCPPDGL